MEEFLRQYPTGRDESFQRLPLRYTNPQTCLPKAIQTGQPFELFSQFFSPDILELIAQRTNEFAAHQIAERQRKRAEKNLSKLIFARGWKPTTQKEILRYIGVQIYMGINKLSNQDMYWNESAPGESVHPIVTQAISKNRFKQIDRYLYLLRLPIPDNTHACEKVLPLANAVRETSSKLWKSSTCLAVDESLSKSMGKNQDIVEIDSKSAKQGVKVYILGDKGYVLDFLFSIKQGVLELPSHWKQQHKISPTHAVVPELIARYQKSPNAQSDIVLFCDNYFTSHKLLSLLRDMGVGYCGTVRKEESRGMWPELLGIARVSEPFIHLVN